jgi:hypothetical protein
MSVDEHTLRLTRGLADRVQEHVSRELQATIEELQRIAAAEQAAAEARMQEQMRLNALRAAGAQLTAITAAETRGREAARANAERTIRAATERLVEGIRRLDDARSLSAILDALADLASQEAPSVALFTVDGNVLRSWKSHGYTAPSSVEIQEGSPLADWLRAGAPDDQDRLGQITLFDGTAGAGRRVLLPIRVGEGVAAVLCAEQGEDGAHVEYSMTLEILTRHAARCLEAVTAARTAQLLVRPAEAAGSQPGTIDRTSWIREPRRPGPDEEAEAARRYARLLVSEIRLYHEDAVIAGRRDRDLSYRLSGEISRARVLYHQRVPPHVPDAAQYFESELVRTLANGDRSLLGQS